MDSGENELISAPIDAAKDVKSSDVCKVCGSEGAHMYLGVPCCASCKMFFRRNANFDLNTEPCAFGGNCKVTMNNRRVCRYCRFKKCLSVGLQKDLLRASHARQDHSREKSQQQRPTKVANEMALSLPVVVPTLDLLRNDRSLLTIDQWSLLSNVVHAFDDQSPASAIRSAMALQSTYPSKIRFKMATDYFKHIASSLYLSAGPFAKTMPEFMTMSTNDQVILIDRNIRSMGGFSGILIMREADVCRNPYYHSASVAIYGPQITNRAMKIVDHADTDGTLIKLLVPILAMSTCSDMIDPSIGNSTHSIVTSGGTRLFSNTLHLLDFQNIYTEMMFKYMLYRYGYNEAALRFASLIKSCLDQILLAAGDGDLRKHDEMVQTITEETERSLTLHDDLME